MRASARIRPEEFLDEDRDDIITARMMQDAIALHDAGIESATIPRILGGFEYVMAWMQLPKLFHSVRKLPKGCNWKDATVLTYQSEGQKNKPYIKKRSFLPVGEDLYIKPVNLPGVTLDVKIVVIRNWKSYTATEVAGHAPIPYPVITSQEAGGNDKARMTATPNGLARSTGRIDGELWQNIADYWKQNGLSLCRKDYAGDLSKDNTAGEERALSRVHLSGDGPEALTKELRSKRQKMSLDIGFRVYRLEDESENDQD